MVAKYRTSDLGAQARASLADQGFVLPDKPSSDPVLPDDVSDLDSKSLMGLFTLFTAWCDYAAAQLGLAVVAEREMERDLEVAEAQAWKNLPKASVSAGKALVALSVEVQDAKFELDKTHAYRRMLSDLASRYERDAAILSRELTRRTSDSSGKTIRRERWTS